MKIFKRIVFWLLLLMSLAACVCWIFTFPYRPERLYSLIPEEATLVTDHEALAGRWSEVARCPTLRALLIAAGGANAQAGSAVSLDTPAVRRLVSRFCPRRTLFAVIPPGPSGASGWMLATWAGRQAQYLRLGLMDRQLSGVTCVRLGGDKLWQWQGRGLPEGQTVSVAVYEGVIIACLSHDPMAAARLRVRAARAALPAPWLVAPPEGWGASFDAARDRAWVRTDSGTPPWRVVLDAVNAEGCRGSIAVPKPMPPGRALTTDGLTSAAGLPIPPGTVALGAMSAGDAAAWVSRSPLPPAVKEAVRGVTKRHVRVDAPVFAWVASGDWSGRVMSLRVPSIFLAVPVTDAAAAIADATNVIDRLNAGLRTSYLPRDMEVEGQAVTVFASARQDPGDVVPPLEKLGMAPFGAWVVFCSNAQTLGRALSAVGEEPPHPAVAALAAAPPGTGAAVWVDTSPAADAARNLKAVYELWVMLSNPPKPPFSRAELAHVEPWLSRLAPLGEVSLDLVRSDDSTTLAFDIRGRRAADRP
jgi:hypothetical protein